MLRWGAIYLLVISCVFVLLFAGCGKKSMLVPPQPRVPGPVADVRYEREGQTVVFSWVGPGRLASGEPLAGVAGYDVQVAEVASEQFCEGCPVVYGPIVKVAAGPAPERRSEYRLRPKKSGYWYVFRVRARTDRWTAGVFSEPVSLQW